MVSVAPPPPVATASPGCFLFSSEAAVEGHPDKVADQVADALVDACLAQDPESRVCCDAATKTGVVLVFGDIVTKAKLDIDVVVRNAVKHIGYDASDKGLDYRTMEVVNKLEVRMPDVAEVQEASDLVPEDNCCAVGYASGETQELMPLTHLLATRIARKLVELRKGGTCEWIRPDGKAQVIVEYRRLDDGALLPTRIHTVIVSAQHAAGTSSERIREDVLRWAAEPVLPTQLVDANIVYHVNSSGRFVIGGPHGDAGISRHQAVSDSYGGWGGASGSGISGRDGSQAERSAAYLTRKAAKSLVGSGLAKRCAVRVAYMGGQAHPVSMSVDSYGSVRNGLSDGALSKIVGRHFDFRPSAMVRDLNLRAPRYQSLAASGCFGRENDPTLEWEQIKDLSCELTGLES